MTRWHRVPSTAAISGGVVDTDGAVIPGASIVVKNTKTGESFNTVSSGAGTLLIPALITGTYGVSVSRESFKTALLNNVVVNSGVPASVRATMEIGGLAEPAAEHDQHDARRREHSGQHQ